MIIKLNREHKKILNLAGIMLLCAVIFLVFIYNPKRVALAKLKAYVDVTYAEEKEIRKMIGDKINLEEGLVMLKERAALLRGKYIKQQDMAEALKVLSDTANRTGVRITSTKPSLAVVFTGSGTEPVKYDSAVCMKMPVSLSVEGRFENLCKFVYSMENNPKGIYTIDGFSIRKEESIFPELKMDLNAGMYYFAGQ